MTRVVSDTSPLISLENIDGGYTLFRQLYGRVLVPPSVLRELAAGPFENEEAYLSHFGIDDLLRVETPENLFGGWIRFRDIVVEAAKWRPNAAL